MRSLRVALAVTATLIAACADSPVGPVPHGGTAAASAKPYLPGEQQPIIVNTSTWGIYPVGTGQIVAQTFTPASTQWLGYIELPVGCEAGVLLNVKIREGLNGPILYEMNVAGLPEDVPGTFQLLQVFDPAVTRHGIRLHKGREYAFELSAFPGPAATGTACGIAVGPPGDSYAGGRGYYQDPINGPAFLPLPTGAPTDDHDLPFRTLVR